MKCPKCQFDSPTGMKFCGQCGAKLGALCRQCGAQAPPDFKFCGECGAPLGAPEPAAALAPPQGSPAGAPTHRQSYTPPHLAEQVLRSEIAVEGERKRVTVLFCDVVSSTALADRLGPEVMHGLLSRFFEVALAEVHRFEGTINQFLGDGFMALFGAPVAHEDHARRAVLAALALKRRLAERRAELGEDAGADLKVRMGINTGLVVVGGIGDRLRMDYTAVGDTTNLAARLQQLALPGTILASEATARLVREEVDLVALPPAAVKGKAEPVQAFQVLDVRVRSPRPADLGSDLYPFVGRERELAGLAELCEQAATGAGQVVGIAGEAGSGKSRLLSELHRRLPVPARVLAGRCLSYGGDVPYLPILHLIRGAWGLSETDPPAALRERIAEGLARGGADLEEALPCLLHLFGIRDGIEGLFELSPQALQMRTFAALRQAILAGGEELVVVEIEDLHWADETSERFLSDLVEGIAGARVLLLLTYRSGYQPRWMDKSYATQISMRRLSGQESRRLVSAVEPRADLPEDLVRTILERAEGNPFFLEELTRSVLERGARTDLPVPDTVQGVLMARIDRLPEPHKRLLQTASVLGREVHPELLRRLGGPAEGIEPLLADLRRWEFLYEAPAGGAPVFLFRHALTQEAVYDSLLTARRQALHAAAGQALEELHASRLEEAYDALAFHFSRAGRPAEAVRYLSLSAAKAARGYAHVEAARTLREALRQAARLPAPEGDRQQVELALQLAESLLPLAAFPETLEELGRQAETVERLGEPALAGRYFFWRAHTHSYLGDQEAAAACAGRAIAEAQRAGDSATEGRARYVLSRDGFWSGRFAEGIEQGLLAVDLLERAGERWWAGQAHWVVGFLQYVLGQFDAAFRSLARTQEVWEALQDPRLDCSWSLGYFLASLGQAERGVEECRGGVERARDPLNTAVSLGFLGYAHLGNGDLARATEVLEDSVRRLRHTGMQQILGWFAGFLGEAYLAAGRLDEARELAEEGATASREVNFGYGAGLAQRTLGRIARAGGELEEAGDRLLQALATFRLLGVPFEEARTRLELALLARDQGRVEEGAREAGEALDGFAQLGVPAYVSRASALAAEMPAGTRQSRGRLSQSAASPAS